MKVVVLLALVLVGCTAPNPRFCGDGTCSDPAFPYCDQDGLIGGAPDTCIDVSCPSAGDFVACKGDSAISCNQNHDSYVVQACDKGCNTVSQGCNQCTPDGSFCTAGGVQHCDSIGMPSTLETCAMGCTDSPAPHCAYISPHYLPDVCDTPATTDVTYGASATLGTDLDTLCTGGVVLQSGAPDICVVRGKRITIESAVVLKVAGARAIAFVADDALDMSGTLDASADGSTSGPGGGSVFSGGGATAVAAGGGAGFKTNGAAGGNGTSDGGAANGGAASTNPSLLAVLVGGAKNGGGGGGAALLISCRGPVTVSGVVDAGGGGGFGGVKPAGTARGGTGGGSGGNVVLQGLHVSVTGSLYANGGGGGAGYTGTANGNAGADANRTSTAAAPGGIVQASEGAGGAGGIRLTGPRVGLAPTAGTAGGGGASVGFFQTYTPDGVDPTLTPDDVSPDFESALHLTLR